mmetsp:Transcript_7734/g.13729  ORF Transcript_7734/g.13729 Transcript_7734/m.13729 type:complete len:226 (-) Transcript_7734:266-943(-)
MELSIEACHGHAARARSAAEARGSLQSSQIDVTGLSASVSDGSCDGGREGREISIVLGAQAVVHLPAEEVGASGEGQDLPRLVGGARGAIQRVLIVGHQVDGLAQAGVAQALRLLKREGRVQGGASEAHHPNATALGGIANLTDKGEGRQGLVDPGAALARLGVEHVGELGQLGATVALAPCSVLRVGLAGREKVLNLAPRVAHLNDHSKCRATSRAWVCLALCT